MSAPEPTRDQLLAMAYVDDELEPAARRALEARLAHDEGLRRQVVEYQTLELLARAAAPREPLDHEWEALARDPVQRGALGLGATLLGLGMVGLVGFGLFELLVSDEPVVLKVILSALLLGTGLLLGATLRARIRSLPLDPYRKIRR